MLYNVFMARRPKQARFQSIARMLKEMGWTYKRIGDLLGVSRQRAQQLIAPTEQERQGYLATYPRSCRICAKEKGKLDYHHLDYVQREIILLCASCHKIIYAVEKEYIF